MAPKTKRFTALHRWLGLMLAVPLLLWIGTGLVFLFKPGYSDAYEQLRVRTYPMERPLNLAWVQGWDELRVSKTTLGYHLLARSDDQWLQLDAGTLQPRPEPAQAAIIRLLQDAVSHNPERYGLVLEARDDTYFTDTGIALSLDWDSLKIEQRGQDTRLINTLYKVHYLQWTPWSDPNRLFVMLVLLALVGLVAIGLSLFRKQSS